MDNKYIDGLVEDKSSVTVYTVNGYQLKGIIIMNYDDSIVLFSGGKNKLIYKHAISTVEPA